MVNSVSFELTIVYVIICMTLNVISLQISGSLNPLPEKYVSGKNTNEIMAVKVSLLSNKS